MRRVLTKAMAQLQLEAVQAIVSKETLLLQSDYLLVLAHKASKLLQLEKTREVLSKQIVLLLLEHLLEDSVKANGQLLLVGVLVTRGNWKMLLLLVMVQAIPVKAYMLSLLEHLPD
jgi:hypothetical protein